MKKFLGMLCLVLFSHEGMAGDNVQRTEDDSIPIVSPPQTPTADNPTLNPNSSYTSLQDVLIPSNQRSGSPGRQDRMEEPPSLTNLKAKIQREHRNQKIVGAFCAAAAIACSVYASVEGRSEESPPFDLRSCLVGAGLSFFIVPLLFLGAHMAS